MTDHALLRKKISYVTVPKMKVFFLTFCSLKVKVKVDLTLKKMFLVPNQIFRPLSQEIHPA